MDWTASGLHVTEVRYQFLVSRQVTPSESECVPENTGNATA